MTLLSSIANFGGPDLIIILLIVLVLFGAKRLPDLAKGMGQAVKEFHKAKDEFGSELHPAESAPQQTNETAALSAPAEKQAQGSAPATRSV